MISPPQRGVASVEVAGAILRALRGANRAIGLLELAALTGMSKSNLHHYMVSLIRTGLARKAPGTNQYLVGSFALELGLAAADNLATQHASAPWLHHLSAATKESSFFAVPSPRGPLIVRWEQGSRPHIVHARLGTVMPILTSATGLVWLAADRAASVDVFERELRRVDPAIRQQVRSNRIDEAEDVRRTGIAAAVGTMIGNVNALACPVFARGSHFAGVLTLLGLGSFFSADLTGRQAKLLRRCAIEFGQTLLHTSRPEMTE